MGTAAADRQETQRFFRHGGLEPNTSVMRIWSATCQVRRPADVRGAQLRLAEERDGQRPRATGGERAFRGQLVSWVQRLRTEENRAILYTALAWRRMEPALLARLCDCSVEKAQVLIEELARFSFTKYRPPTEGFAGSFQLHDEMRTLIREHAWKAEGHKTERDLLEQIVGLVCGEGRLRIAPADAMAGRARRRPLHPGLGRAAGTSSGRQRRAALATGRVAVLHERAGSDAGLRAA